MFGFGKHRTIRVEMFLQSAAEPFAECALPSQQLPESFEADTTMHVGDRDYSVVRAEPMTRAEFQKSGTLRLTLVPVERVSLDPSRVLFSLPTISNELPTIQQGTSKLNARTLEMHEDEWRQVEFVATSLQTKIDAELEQIRRIHREEREEFGFKSVHVRRLVPRPLIGSQLLLSSLRRQLSAAQWVDGISLTGIAGMIDAGFAARLSAESCLYGLEQDGVVSVLGTVNFIPDVAAIHGDSRELLELARAQRLSLVDWCQARQYSL